MSQELLNQVMSDIQINWDRVLRPSAPRDRWHSELSQLLPTYPVWNYTDFNYDKCHTYAILLHSGPFRQPGSLREEIELLTSLGGSLTYLVVSMSVVGPYFRVIVEERTLDTNGNLETHRMRGDQNSEALELVRGFATGKGFVDLPEDILQAVIPNAELDLKPLGQVTVYNCLFYDEDA